MGENQRKPPRVKTKRADLTWERVILWGMVIVCAYLGMWGLFFTNPFRGPYRGSELHSAARNGDLAKVRQLVASGADVRAVDEFNEQAICIALWNGHEDIADYLLLHGGHLEDVSTNGSSCIEGITTHTYFKWPEGQPRPSEWIEDKYYSRRGDILRELNAGSANSK